MQRKEFFPVNKTNPALTKKKLLIFAILAVPACLFLYSCIIAGGAGISGGSIFALALMWVPGLAALFAKLAVDHTLRGLGWRIHGASLPSLAAAYLVPLVLSLFSPTIITK